MDINLPQLSSHPADSLDNLITQENVKATVYSIKMCARVGRGDLQGIDSLPVEYYFFLKSRYKRMLLYPLTQGYLEAPESGSFPYTFNEDLISSIISLIPKI